MVTIARTLLEATVKLDTFAELAILISSLSIHMFKTPTAIIQLKKV